MTEMFDFISRNEVLAMLNACIAESDGYTPIVDDTLIAVKEAVEKMPGSDAVRDALEKQIPKKPLHIRRSLYCPVCKEDGWITWDDGVPQEYDRYCGICGQAIDLIGEQR